MPEEKISKQIIKEPFWSLSSEETFKILKSSPSGLTQEEAEKRLAIFGQNEILEKERSIWLTIAWRQLQNPLINILMIAGAITILLRDWIDTAAIFAAVIVNISMGFWQEFKAEKSLELLKTYLKTRAIVRRDGNEREIDASLLVPGDIIRISQGDRIPADARIIFAKNLEVDESVLTGESLPVIKNTSILPAGTILPERKCMVWSGTLVFQGFADAIVTATGKESEFGKIAALLSKQRHEATPLQRSITRFTVVAGIILGILSLILFFAGLFAGYKLYEIFLIAVAVAVAAVPEALPVALTTTLAIGVVRLSKKGGIVRKLLAAETLGSTTLILTDKTGTLTQAKMQLEEILPYDKSDAEAEFRLLRAILLNCDVVIENPNDPIEKWQIIGRPLEVALVKAAALRGILYPYLKMESEIIDRLPFSSETKISAVIFRQNATLHLTILGAPEKVLDHCKITDNERALIEEEINLRAAEGQRILAAASKELTHDEMVWEKFLKDPKRELKFLGLISLKDPLRPEAKIAVKKILEAGVKTVIVTGDHKGTAISIARELGIIDEEKVVLSGTDLKQLSEEELKVLAPNVAVFARLDPVQKLQLVKLYKSLGQIVAVTGDGVNDAPALHAADIGVALGSGTEVAKNASDLILLDDNFQTLVNAIEEGRRIIDNIRKVIIYLLSNVLDGLLLIGSALLSGLPLPLNAIQILFVNFFADSFPAIALAFESEIEENSKKPSKVPGHLIDREMAYLIFGVGIFTSILLAFLYWIFSKISNFPQEIIRTFIFATFATYTLFLPFAIRSLKKSIFRYNIFSNRHLVAATSIGIILTLCSIYFPGASLIFKTVALPIKWLIAVFAFGILSIALVEIIKFFLRYAANNK